MEPIFRLRFLPIISLFALVSFSAAQWGELAKGHKADMDALEKEAIAARAPSAKEN